jgi:ubiquinol-cytochrome c reductase iron-sulfur subunit
MRTAFFLLLTIACALGATVAAAVGGSPVLLGGLLFGTFVGLAGAGSSAAVALGAPDDLREPREARGPTNPQPYPEERLTRRVFGKLWLGAIGALLTLGFVPLVSLARKPGRRARTGWTPGARLVTTDNTPIRLDYLETGGITTVFPLGEVDVPEAPAVLIRVEPEMLHLPADRKDWAPDGYIAFSKICTHAGCPVALYRHASHQLYCPCHQSMFDVLHLANNIAGPAPRPLPQLGLDVDPQGYLIARGDFAGPVGPDDWDRLV